MRAQPQVAASEGDDPQIVGLAGGDGEAVGPEARAGDGRPRRDEALGGVEDRRAAGLVEAIDRDAGLDRRAERPDLGRHGAGHRGEVDDSGLRGVQGGDADRVRLDLRDLRAAQPAQARDAVLAAAALELVQARAARTSSRAMMSLPQRSYAIPCSSQYA